MKQYESGIPLLDMPTDTMGSFRFHSWLIVEIVSDSGEVGIGNAALSPRVNPQGEPVTLTIDGHEVTTAPGTLLIEAARQAGIELQLEADSTPTITGDGDRLMQVFNNLVDNAIKFTPSGGKVALRSYQENGQVVVSVADTGIGLAPEEKERIFERFYQADRSRPGGLARGAGLGLAIAREIVHAHGGSISVTSQPGKGSIFIVRLPIAAKSESPSENASA